MAYAIESKKRKFDRILEGLTESTSKTPQSPSQSTSIISSKIGSHDSVKRRRVTPIQKRSASRTSVLTSYLPSSRVAFLERLETFRHVTKWHIPSTIPVNAAEWAKRGWFCADVDTVACGSCSERVTVDLTINLQQQASLDESSSEIEDEAERLQNTQDTDDMAVQVYDALVQRYQTMIITSHREDCSWRKRGCDESIQRIEGLLNTTTAIDSAQSRLGTMVSNIEDFPPVINLPSYHVSPTPSREILRSLSSITDDLNALQLAVCGWQYKEADVIVCKNCFRSLGLWLYRGAAPTMENLDPVQSHLEYCPWRCPDAQDTEYMFPTEAVENQTRRVKLPGWALVYHAIKKQALKLHQGKAGSTLSLVHTDGLVPQNQLSPEQRDRRMKDLLRRMKEIKKPFSVRGLLRKKDRSEI